MLGKEVTTLVNEEKKPGNYNVELNASKLAAKRSILTSGVYFYRMQASARLFAGQASLASSAFAS